MNRADVARLLALPSAVFPQYPLTTETIHVYAELLADVSWDAAVAAMRKLLTTTDKWPTVAALRATIAQDHGSLAPTKGEAWAEVREQVKRAGRFYRPHFTHAAITETVEQIGWWDICQTDAQDVMRAQFWRVYEDNAKRHDSRALTEPGLLALPQRLDVPQIASGPPVTHEDPPVAPEIATEYVQAVLAALKERAKEMSADA